MVVTLYLQNHVNCLLMTIFGLIHLSLLFMKHGHYLMLLYATHMFCGSDHIFEACDFTLHSSLHSWHVLRGSYFLGGGSVSRVHCVLDESTCHQGGEF